MSHFAWQRTWTTPQSGASLGPPASIGGPNKELSDLGSKVTWPSECRYLRTGGGIPSVARFCFVFLPTFRICSWAAPLLQQLPASQRNIQNRIFQNLATEGWPPPVQMIYAPPCYGTPPAPRHLFTSSISPSFRSVSLFKDVYSTCTCGTHDKSAAYPVPHRRQSRTGEICNAFLSQPPAMSKKSLTHFAILAGSVELLVKVKFL